MSVTLRLSVGVLLLLGACSDGSEQSAGSSDAEGEALAGDEVATASEPGGTRGAEGSPATDGSSDDVTANADSSGSGSSGDVGSGNVGSGSGAEDADAASNDSDEGDEETPTAASDSSGEEDAAPADDGETPTPANGEATDPDPPGEAQPDETVSDSGEEADSTSESGDEGEASTDDEMMMSEAWTPEFETLALSGDFVAEGAQVADIDGDGELDLVAGASWYQGPDFETQYPIDDVPPVEVTAYSLYFLTFADDVDSDGDVDVITVGDAGGGNGTGTPNTWWYENPGPEGVTMAWERHVVFDGLVSNESPAYLDLAGDERKELVFMTDQRLGWAAPGADPTQPWEFVPISGAEFSTPYVHGLGIGDVDSDGLMDVIEASGWWRQLPDDGGWEKTEANFTEGVGSQIVGGAQMYAFDVDGDGDSDVVTSLSGHGYGLSWFEQTDGGFAAHGILPPMEADGNVSQLHAVGAADMNGDGLMDIVTGKRYYAHSRGDPGVEGAALLYWFELVRETDQSYFEPHLIHDDSGVGCNFTVADVDGNGRPDVFTTSKKGTFLHSQ